MKWLGMVVRAVRAPQFFYVVVALLVLQASWIALTALYPQAFDENYHFGLIQLHAQQLLPFFTHQPPDSAVYGAVVRDPSYLFHWLMTFPYHALTWITDSQTAQIIVLRFLNIGIFVAGLFVYRKLFDELGVSTALRNVVLLFFVLLPIVPLLAGHINYDNVMFVTSGLLFLYAARLIRLLHPEAGNDMTIPISLILKIIIVGALGSLVKFPFAPIFFAVTVVLVFLGARRWLKLGRPMKPLSETVVWPGRLKLAALVVITLVSAALFFERYGVNVIQYGTPVPKCDKVLSVAECQAYSPWARDYLFAATYPRPTTQGVVVYPFVWVHRMVFETMFTITSYFEPNGVVTYKPHAPLTITNYTGWVVVTAGALLAVLARRRIWGNPALRLMLIVIAFYSLVLLLQNFAMYLHSGEAVAIHGRYLIPVYPILLLALAIGFASWLERKRLERHKALLLVVVLVFFLQGGGIIGWIIKSNPSWHWQHIPAAATANNHARNILNKFVITSL